VQAEIEAVARETASEDQLQAANAFAEAQKYDGSTIWLEGKMQVVVLPKQSQFYGRTEPQFAACVDW